MGYLTPHKHGVSAYTKVYEIQIDRAPNYNKDDFVEYFWLTPKKLFQKIKSGDKARGDLPKLVKFFYGA
ncbi:hypothetical protein MYX06_01795 [Patescibacteria group bacterium AH-259-L05]|nr:hypothetical protein [Patescibacteria group bacterium AH-259-L05]